MPRLARCIVDDKLCNELKRLRLREHIELLGERERAGGHLSYAVDANPDKTAGSCIADERGLVLPVVDGAGYGGGGLQVLADVTEADVDNAHFSSVQYQPTITATRLMPAP